MIGTNNLGVMSALISHLSIIRESAIRKASTFLEVSSEFTSLSKPLSNTGRALVLKYVVCLLLSGSSLTPGPRSHAHNLLFKLISLFKVTLQAVITSNSLSSGANIELRISDPNGMCVSNKSKKPRITIISLAWLKDEFEAKTEAKARARIPGSGFKQA